MKTLQEIILANCPHCFEPVADGYTFCSDKCEREFHEKSLAECGVKSCGNPECQICEPVGAAA
jgi:hypothetical protein